MHYTLKLTQVGNSVGAIFPKEALSAMNLSRGDKVILSRTDNGFHISPFNPALTDQLEAARKIMTKRRYVLRELAQ